MNVNETVAMRLNLLLAQKQYGRLKSMILSIPLIQLVTYFEERPVVKPLLCGDYFSTCWKNYMKQSMFPFDSSYHFQESALLKSHDIVLGYDYYQRALQAEKMKEYMGYKQAMFMALEHYSIHAAQSIVHRNILKLNDASMDDLLSFQTVLCQLENLAVLNKMPGYLMLANGYRHLAKVCEHNALKISEAAFYAALKFLYLAKKSQPHSTVEHHNAYFGKGLELSNPFGHCSIDAMIMDCEMVCEGILSKERQLQAKGEADILNQKPFKSFSLFGKPILTQSLMNNEFNVAHFQTLR